MEKLYNIKHPYYCTHDNFFKRPSSQCETRFKFNSFDEFLKNCGSMDEDLNFLFRWDWINQENERHKALELHEKYSKELKFDDTYSDQSDKLELFYFLQRKGYMIVIIVDVSKDDEEKVKDYLTSKFNHIKLTWNPII